MTKKDPQSLLYVALDLLQYLLIQALLVDFRVLHDLPHQVLPLLQNHTVQFLSQTQLVLDDEGPEFLPELGWDTPPPEAFETSSLSQGGPALLILGLETLWGKFIYLLRSIAVSSENDA